MNEDEVRLNGVEDWSLIRPSALPTKEVGIAQSDGGGEEKKLYVSLSEVNDDEVRMNGVEDSSQVHSSTLPTKEVGIAQSDGGGEEKKLYVGLSEVNEDEVRLNGVEDWSLIRPSARSLSYGHSSTLPTKEVGIAQSDGGLCRQVGRPDTT